MTLRLNFTEYGKALVAPWNARAFEDLENGRFKGTSMYEPLIKTVEDAAAWCLMTDNVYALHYVDEWIEDGATEVWGIDIQDLKAELQKCITE